MVNSVSPSGSKSELELLIDRYTGLVEQRKKVNTLSDNPIVVYLYELMKLEAEDTLASLKKVEETHTNQLLLCVDKIGELQPFANGDEVRWAS